MNTYEIITSLRNLNLLNQSICKGVISQIYMDYINIYEKYLAKRKAGVGKMQAYCDLSEDFSVSETTIRNIIKKMQA